MIAKVMISAPRSSRRIAMANLNLLHLRSFVPGTWLLELTSGLFFSINVAYLESASLELVVCSLLPRSAFLADRFLQTVSCRPFLADRFLQTVSVVLLALRYAPLRAVVSVPFRKSDAPQAARTIGRNVAEQLDTLQAFPSFDGHEDWPCRGVRRRPCRQINVSTMDQACNVYNEKPFRAATAKAHRSKSPAA
jgi:hypothetical protein